MNCGRVCRPNVPQQDDLPSWPRATCRPRNVGVEFRIVDAIRKVLDEKLMGGFDIDGWAEDVRLLGGEMLGEFGRVGENLDLSLPQSLLV